MIKRIYKKLLSYFIKQPLTATQKIEMYFNNGAVPWSIGYQEYKWQEIIKYINNIDFIENLRLNNQFKNHGIGLDERIIEYLWVFANIEDKETTLLDAGSTFNFKAIVNHEIIKKKKLSILTFYPEDQCFYDHNISYIYNDLRDLPFKNALFDEIVCLSTLEHIAMDNSMYGYRTEAVDIIVEKNYEYLKVISELNRVLKDSGILLLTIPYGIFENHGFFQQFDAEMIANVTTQLEKSGIVQMSYFKYEREGWKSSIKEECDDATSFNPHTGKGKGFDGAAHSRAICCLKFKKIRA